MKEIISKHRQDFSELRRLCLVCHGLDFTTSSFSSESSCISITEPLETALQNLLSSNLLSLAVAIRINLYQSAINQPDIELPNSSWLYYDKELISRPATLKQVCDKIIHADTVAKPILPASIFDGSTKITIQFKGSEQQGKKPWTLDIVLQRFAEDILKLLGDIESEKA